MHADKKVIVVPKGVKEYRNVEDLECEALDEHNVECMLFYTPDSHPYFRIPKPDMPVTVGIFRVSNADCKMFNKKLMCQFEEGYGECKIHTPLAPSDKTRFLECGEDILER